MSDNSEYVLNKRENTVRQAIINVLKQTSLPLSAKDISALVGVSEKDIYGHLEHIKRSSRNADEILRLRPAECKKCGYLFAKRDRLDKPGKCPLCREQRIQEPLFYFE